MAEYPMRGELKKNAMGSLYFTRSIKRAFEVGYVVTTVGPLFPIAILKTTWLIYTEIANYRYLSLYA